MSEGYAVKSNLEKARFFYIALSSLEEVRYFSYALTRSQTFKQL